MPKALSPSSPTDDGPSDGRRTKDSGQPEPFGDGTKNLEARHNEKHVRPHTPHSILAHTGAR